MSTYSIEHHVEAAFIVLLGLQAQLNGWHLVHKDADTPYDGKCVVVSAEDQGEEAGGSGVRRLELEARVELASRAKGTVVNLDQALVAVTKALDDSQPPTPPFPAELTSALGAFVHFSYFQSAAQREKADDDARQRSRKITVIAKLAP